MRRSIVYTHLVALVLATAYMATMEQPESILTSVVHHRARQSAQATPEARILFVGDMMFDRSVRRVAEEKGYDFLFSCLGETLSNADGVIGNLEGPITSYPSVSISKKVGEVGNTQFTFSPQVISALNRSGFVAVSIGNNHIRDFGPEGIRQTREALDVSNIVYTGDPNDSTNKAAHLTINGVSFSLIAYNQFGGKLSDTLDALAEHKDQTTVVFAHWGDEYVAPTALQRSYAKQFVEAGADLVIGAHPHVIQDAEGIEGVPVFYSLGNFIFDQYWNESVRKGMGVTVLITPQGIVSYEKQFFRLENDRRTCVVSQ